MWDQLGYYDISFSRDAEDLSDNITLVVTAPQTIDEDGRRSNSHPVTVGNGTGYYTATDSGNGVLKFISSNGWGYKLRGPVDKQQLVRIAESISVIDNGTE